MPVSPAGRSPALERALQVAQAAARSASWEAAGAAWTRVMDLAVAERDLPLARQAALQGVDALRRDDRPASILALLRRSADLAEAADDRGVHSLFVVAALMDLGQLDLAERAGREAVASPVSERLRPVLVDTLSGVSLARGDLIGLRGLVAQLELEAQGPARPAAMFRRAQLDRLEGRLEDAERGFLLCAQALAEVPGAAGARAAALGELGELALYRRQAEVAGSFFNAASKAWEEAGRRGAQLQVEVGRALVALQSGATTYLPGLLDQPIRYAEARNLPLLEARLRLARGLCRHAVGLPSGEADLDAAILLADTADAPWLAGLVRYHRHQAGVSAQIDELRRAVEQLTGNLPWSCRALLALARALAPAEPEEALRLASAALCRFGAMGLDEDEAEARELVLRLSA